MKRVVGVLGVLLVGFTVTLKLPGGASAMPNADGYYDPQSGQTPADAPADDYLQYDNYGSTADIYEEYYGSSYYYGYYTPYQVPAHFWFYGIPGNPWDGDADYDETPDEEDLCPNDFAKQEYGLCGCGFLEADGDGDGNLDCRDYCPSNPFTAKSASVCGCDRAVVEIRDVPFHVFGQHKKCAVCAPVCDFALISNKRAQKDAAVKKLLAAQQKRNELKKRLKMNLETANPANEFIREEDRDNNSAWWTHLKNYFSFSQRENQTQEHILRRILQEWGVKVKAEQDVTADYVQSMNDNVLVKDASEFVSVNQYVFNGMSYMNTLISFGLFDYQRPGPDFSKPAPENSLPYSESDYVGVLSGPSNLPGIANGVLEGLYPDYLLQLKLREKKEKALRDFEAARDKITDPAELRRIEEIKRYLEDNLSKFRGVERDATYLEFAIGVQEVFIKKLKARAGIKSKELMAAVDDCLNAGAAAGAVHGTDEMELFVCPASFPPAPTPTPPSPTATPRPYPSPTPTPYVAATPMPTPSGYYYY